MLTLISCLAVEASLPYSRDRVHTHFWILKRSLATYIQSLTPPGCVIKG